MEWFKFYQEFATDPKVQMMSEVYQRRLVMVFCIRCNENVTLHDNEVTFQLRISEQEWAETKAEFIKRGFIDCNGNVTNWDKRQERPKSSKERVAEHRERKKALHVTNGNENVTTVTPQIRSDQIRIDQKERSPLPPSAPRRNEGKRSGSFEARSLGSVLIGSGQFDIRSHLDDQHWRALIEYAPQWDRNVVCEKYNAFVVNDPPKKPTAAFMGWLKKNSSWLGRAP